MTSKAEYEGYDQQELKLVSVYQQQFSFHLAQIQASYMIEHSFNTSNKGRFNVYQRRKWISNKCIKNQRQMTNSRYLESRGVH